MATHNHLQVHRLFPVTQRFSLSRLVFSTDALISSHTVLLGKEVHSANDYVKCIRPFKGLHWPNALLKFNIVDTDKRLRNMAFGG